MDFRNSRIDLHIHSTASDGSLTPTDIIALAEELNLAAISITDHDTLEGVRQIAPADLPKNLHFLTGIEISASPPAPFPAKGSMHLLGYGLRLNEPALNNALDRLKTARDHRTPGILARLNRLGFSITLEEVLQCAGEGQAGRPHIAECMVKKGYATDIDDAFNRYLGHGKPAYVDRYRISVEEAIALVRSAGGVPVLAHPGLCGLTDLSMLEALVEVLVEAGLMGVEVYYPSHSAAFTGRLIALARKLDLLMTGGTDFHGSLKPNTFLGTGDGDLYVPFGLYEKLAAAVLR